MSLGVTPPSHDAPGDPSIRGREPERARVDAFVAALDGGPATLTLRGEPGIGKSTLWWYGVERSRKAGFRVLVTRTAEEEVALPFGALVDLLEHADQVVEGDAADDGLAVGRALLEALERLVVTSPIVLAIDDAQWLDSASSRAIRFALRRVASRRIGVLATLPGSGGDRLQLEGVLDGPAETLDVGPLPPSALRVMLAGILPTVSKPLLHRISNLSGGNPLHAIEIAQSLAAVPSGDEPPDALPLPVTLRATIAGRLERAPRSLDTLLETLSALGHATVSDLSEAVAAAELEPLIALGENERILVRDADGSVRFAHPVIGSVLYERMDPSHRRRIHATLAGRATDRDRRSRHLALANIEPDAAVAATLDEAVVRAERRSAFDVAAELARHALRLTPNDAESDRLRRAHREIRLLARAGEAGRALLQAERLIASLPPGPQRAETLVLRSDLESDTSAVSRRLLLQALQDAGDDTGLRGRVMQELAFTLFVGFGDARGALVHAREAVRIAEAAGDAETILLARADLAHFQAIAGAPAIDAIREAVTLEDASTDLRRRSRILLIKQHRWAGELNLGRAASESGATDEFTRPYMLYERALIECAAGDLAAGDELVRQGIEEARDAEDGYLEPLLTYPRALLAAWLGRAAEARAAAVELRGDGPGDERVLERIMAGRVLGLLALSEGNAAVAAAELTESARLCEVGGIAHPGVYAVLPDAIEALALSSGAEAAGQLFERLERQASGIESVWVEAVVARSRGMLDLAEGRARAAIAPLAQAVDGFRRCGCRPDAARAQLILARALLRTGKRARAVEELTETGAAFATMGAVLWEDRAAEDLARAAHHGHVGDLTSTESRVATLVAGGMRNQEIANALSLKVATVEAHLTRIYRKLDIRSRSEVGRLAAEGRIAGPGLGPRDPERGDGRRAPRP